MGSRRWVSAHLFYQGDLDTLLLRGVRPLVAELGASGSIDRYFFIRYWEGGPHARLRILPGEGVAERSIEKLIDQRIGEFFASWPSRDLLDPARYAKSATQLAKLEYGQERVLEPLRPNNSVRYAPYVPEYERYAGDRCTEVVERNFMDSSELSLGLIADCESRNQLTGRAFSMMLLGAAICGAQEQKLARFFSIGHLDWGRRLTAGDRNGYEARFEREYRKQEKRLSELARRLLKVVKQEDHEDFGPALSRWVDSIEAVKKCLVRSEPTPPPQRQNAGRSEAAPVPDRLGARALILYCLHMNNNRLGLSPNEEAYLVFLIQRVLEEIDE